MKILYSCIGWLSIQGLGSSYKPFSFPFVFSFLHRSVHTVSCEVNVHPTHAFSVGCDNPHLQRRAFVPQVFIRCVHSVAFICKPFSIVYHTPRVEHVLPKKKRRVFSFIFFRFSWHNKPQKNLPQNQRNNTKIERCSEEVGCSVLITHT